jgi:hypothetical protein
MPKPLRMAHKAFDRHGRKGIRVRLASSFLRLALAAAAVAIAVPASHAEGIAPGLWKITTTTILNGAQTSPEAKARCLSADQATDPAKTFSPEYATVNSECRRTEYDASGRKLSWRLQCKGQIDMEVSGDFVFETPKRYTATILTRGWMAGRQMMSSSAAIEGEHVGDCP